MGIFSYIWPSEKTFWFVFCLEMRLSWFSNTWPTHFVLVLRTQARCKVVRRLPAASASRQQSRKVVP